jgi:hypothetical protein
MPEIRYYTATQEREVKIWASSPGEAAQIADAIFNDDKTEEPDQDALSRIRSPIRERSLDVREDY